MKKMKKHRISLNEARLHKIISESIGRVINEGTTYDQDMDNWDKAEEYMGSHEMLDALYQYLDCDTIHEFIETLRREYELPLGTEDEDFEEDEFAY